MQGNRLEAVGRLIRLDSSLILFLAVAGPVFWHSRDLHAALSLSIPVLLGCAAGFVLNDLCDMEEDLINHPARPLPARRVTPTQASLLYFLILGAALSVIYFTVPWPAAFLHVLFLLGLNNYNYVIDFLPKCKAPFLAVVGCLPLMVVVPFLPDPFQGWSVVGSLVMFVLGREILMDVLDIKGDGVNSATALGPVWAPRVGLASLSLAPLLLLAFAPTLLHGALAALLVAASLVIMRRWATHPDSRPALIQSMKLQMLAGIAMML